MSYPVKNLRCGYCKLLLLICPELDVSFFRKRSTDTDVYNARTFTPSKRAHQRGAVEDRKEGAAGALVAANLEMRGGGERCDDNDEKREEALQQRICMCASKAFHSGAELTVASSHVARKQSNEELRSGAGPTRGAGPLGEHAGDDDSAPLWEVLGRCPWRVAGAALYFNRRPRRPRRPRSGRPELAGQERPAWGGEGDAGGPPSSAQRDDDDTTAVLLSPPSRRRRLELLRVDVGGGRAAAAAAGEASSGRRGRGESKMFGFGHHGQDQPPQHVGGGGAHQPTFNIFCRRPTRATSTRSRPTRATSTISAHGMKAAPLATPVTSGPTAPPLAACRRSARGRRRHCPPAPPLPSSSRAAATVLLAPPPRHRLREEGESGVAGTARAAAGGGSDGDHHHSRSAR
uniref:Uncharacterized protein n=1 Tax=Oryza sativa subsp. japonica TaxID=39947 RepID=Q6H801_ORYSJ|nr:hypothetical protein [Oryza sativa Japonica Group]